MNNRMPLSKEQAPQGRLLLGTLAIIFSCARILAGTPDAALPNVSVSQRTVTPLLKAERPYEDFSLGWCTVLRVGGEWRMWYESLDHTYRNDADGFLCYAQSKDGVHWERPDLGLVEYGGNKHNNILLSGIALGNGGFHGSNVFLDESAPAAERYKLVFVRESGGAWWVYGAVSADGLRWKVLDKPLLKKNSDTQTVCIRDKDVYRLYVRMWSAPNFSGQRQVGYCESKTFGDFPDPKVILSPDEKDPKTFHFYNSAAAKVNDTLYVLFPGGYSGDETVRPHVALSSDGIQFKRLAREPLLDLGKGFDSQTVYVSPGVVPAEKPGTYWVYYMGFDVKHDQNVPTKVKYGGGLGRFLLTISK